MKLYAFDHIDESLKLIPLAARRALDGIGKKLSLDGFHSLPIEERRRLTLAGSRNVLDTSEAKAAILSAIPKATDVPPVPEPDQERASQALTAIFGPGRPLPDKVWQALSPLDRYALHKVALKNRPERVTAAYNEIVGASSVSTHLRAKGGVHMVSVSEKEPSLRQAVAECLVTMSPEAFQRLENATAPKGDVLATARLAGIMATKKTSDLIPLCHPLSLEHAEVDFESEPASNRIRVLCQVTVRARTGVEMEAMVGANVAALTIYDMLKSIDRGMVVGPCRLLHKSGGRSGSFDGERAQ